MTFNPTVHLACRFLCLLWSAYENFNSKGKVPQNLEQNNIAQSNWYSKSIMGFAAHQVQGIFCETEITSLQEDYESLSRLTAEGGRENGEAARWCYHNNGLNLTQKSIFIQRRLTLKVIRTSIGKVNDGMFRQRVQCRN